MSRSGRDVALQFHCPVEAALAVIGGKWKVVILYHLTHEGVHRFAELRRKIPGVSERMLTQQLRELEEDGVVHREVYPQVPPRVEYSLTEYGHTLRAVTAVMCDWGTKHLRRLGRLVEKKNGALLKDKSAKRPEAAVSAKRK